MKLKTIIEIVSDPSIMTPADALNAGLPLQLLGSGSYRSVFDIVGTNLVIKFPNDEYLQRHECIRHSAKEYEAVTKIMSSRSKAYAAIKKHMPKIHFYNPITGVLLANKYRLLGLHKMEDRRLLSLKLKDAIKVNKTLDVQNSGNVGIDGRGTLKVIDAGYLLGI